MYLSARFRGDVPSGDTLRIPEKYRKYRYANISQLFQGFKNADMLEIFQALCNRFSVTHSIGCCIVWYRQFFNFQQAFKFYTESR